MQGLHILDLESFEVKVIQAENCNGVLEVEAQHEGLQEIGSLLDGSNVFCSLGSLIFKVKEDRGTLSSTARRLVFILT